MILASANGNVRNGPKVGKYTVNVKGLESIIDDAFLDINPQIRIIDEIGKMELLSSKVTRELTRQIDSKHKVLICTIPARSQHRLVKGKGSSKLTEMKLKLSFTASPVIKL